MDALRGRTKVNSLLKKVKVLEDENIGLTSRVKEWDGLSVDTLVEEKERFAREIQDLKNARLEDSRKFEQEVGKEVNARNMAEEKLVEVERELLVLGKRVEHLLYDRDGLEQKMSAMQMDMDHVSENLAAARADYEILGEWFDSCEKELEDTKWKLEVAPNRESPP